MKLSTFDAWFPRIWRLLIGLGGLAIILWQGLHHWTTNPELYLAALTMMGFAVANKIVETVGALGPQHSQGLPPPSPSSTPTPNGQEPPAPRS